MKTIFIVIGGLLAPYLVHAQSCENVPLQISQEVLIGGTNHEGYLYHPPAIATTSDSGFITISTTMSSDGDVQGFHGLFDVYVAKTDANLNLLWGRAYGGSDHDFGVDIVSLPDGSSVFVGITGSEDGDVGSNPMGKFWVVKVDPFGTIIWKRYYGGTGTNNVQSISCTLDGGFIITCQTLVEDGDISNPIGGFDFWVICTDANGNLIWERSLGYETHDYVKDAIQTTDGNFLVYGHSRGPGDEPSNGYHGETDLLLYKLDLNGNVILQSTFYGGGAIETASNVIQNSSGEILLSATTTSINGDVTGHHGTTDEDVWILKLDSNLQLIWSKCYGGVISDSAIDIQEAANDTYFIAAKTNSNDGDVTTQFCNDNVWLVRIDGNGNILHQNTFGGFYSEHVGELVVKSSESVYISAIHAGNEVNIQEQLGLYDLWLFNCTSPENEIPSNNIDDDCDGQIDEDPVIGCTYPNAINYNSLAEIDNGNCLFPGCRQMGAVNYCEMCNIEDGNCIFENCPGDFNDNGLVDIGDLLQFLAFFASPCP